MVEVLLVYLSSQDKPKKMSLAEIDALVAGIGDMEDDDDAADSDEDIDDNQLLAELKVCFHNSLYQIYGNICVIFSSVFTCSHWYTVN